MLILSSVQCWAQQESIGADKRGVGVRLLSAQASQRSPACYEEVITSSAHTSALITIQRQGQYPLPSDTITDIALENIVLQSLAVFNSHFSHKTLFSCKQQAQLLHF